MVTKASNTSERFSRPNPFLAANSAQNRRAEQTVQPMDGDRLLSGHSNSGSTSIYALENQPMHAIIPAHTSFHFAGVGRAFGGVALEAQLAAVVIESAATHALTFVASASDRAFVERVPRSILVPELCWNPVAKRFEVEILVQFGHVRANSRSLITFAACQSLAHASVTTIQTVEAWKHGVHRDFTDVVLFGFIGGDFAGTLTRKTTAERSRYPVSVENLYYP